LTETTASDVACDLVVETRGLTKRYSGGLLAVDDLSLNVRRGEIYGFLGPNGAGKTTTLRMLVGLIRPTAGSAVVAGHPPGSPASLAKIGCVVENPAFYPYMSGRDNLRLIARSARVPDSQVEAALDEVDLVKAAGGRYGSYSQGQKQRLGVAAALVKSPELLILDEPTNGLDPQGMVEMRDLIKSLGKGGRTVLISSHLLHEVEQVCDRYGVIRGGRLIAEGAIAGTRYGGILLRAKPLAKARQALSVLLGRSAVRSLDGALLINAPPTKAPEINRYLVESGVQVSELRPLERSLEEIFLALTGDRRFQ
jgi:ABC-type multidrug transport system ATPase subunit